MRSRTKESPSQTRWLIKTSDELSSLRVFGLRPLVFGFGALGLSRPKTKKNQLLISQESVLDVPLHSSGLRIFSQSKVASA